VTGTALSRSIEMPNDSAVVCIWSNAWTKPLTLVKSSKVVSDPVNGTINPKAIPGAVIEYEIIVANPAPNPIDAGSVVLTDPIPRHLDMIVADLGAGTGPIIFLDGPASGAPSSGMTLSYPADVAFSSDGGTSWDYAPTATGDDGIDPAVNAIRITPQGTFNADDAEFRIRFRARVH
jgi:uncharacterized repeat protein (TIGR01451 family)